MGHEEDGLILIDSMQIYIMTPFKNDLLKFSSENFFTAKQLYLQPITTKM